MIEARNGNLESQVSEKDSILSATTVKDGSAIQ